MKESPPPADTRSFLERTGPPSRPRDVPHVDLTVTRREGPDSLEWSLPHVKDIAASCYFDDIHDSVPLFPSDHDDVPFTMTLDTRADGTIAEVIVEPITVSNAITLCLLRKLSAQPLHLDHTPRHIVLGFAARVWWSSR